MSDVKNVIFVLNNLSDYEKLTSSNEGSQTYVLDASKDVLSQMADILKDYSNLDAIHLFSHGSDGSLDLGSTSLNSYTLAENASVLSSIGASLSEDGDMLLYGCNVAQGQTGVEFINKLAQATAADIAASDDLTGSSALGGDWVLESASGTIEAPVMNLLAYTGILADPYVMNDTIDEGTDISNPEGSSTQGSGMETSAKFTVTSNNTGGSLYVNGNQVSGSYTVTGYDGSSHIDYEIRGLSGTSAGSYSLAFDIDYDNDGSVEWNDTINLTVNAAVPPNTAPTASNGALYVNEGQTNSISLYDLVNDAETADSGLTYSGTGVSGSNMSYTASTNASLKGQVNVTSQGYTVQDPEGLTASGSVSVYVTYADDPTVWNSRPTDVTWNASGGQSANWASGASDPDDGVNYYYDSGKATWMSGTTTITGNPGVSDSGNTYTINTHASGSTTVNDSFDIVVSGGDALNDAPTSANNSKSVSEDVTLTFASGDFSFSDADSGTLYNTLEHVKIVSLTSNGTLKLSDVDVHVDDTIATADLGNLTFEPTADYNGGDSFTFAVSDGLAYSSTQTMSITVNPINDAPVLAGIGADMSMITENETANVGQLVSTILATQTDPDDPIGSDTHGTNNGLLQGIAIYGTTVNGPASDGGHWEYKVGAGSWTAIGTVSDTTALLLKSDDYIRFVPDAKNGQTASFDYYAWDQSAGTTAGTKVNVATRGDTTPYSTASDTTSIVVDDVNDAPTIATPVAQNVYEDNALTITTLSFDDVDINHLNRDDSLTTNDVVEVTLSVAHGVLTLNDPVTNNITISSGTNGSSATLTFQGTLTDVNAAVNGLIYTPDLNYNRYIGDTDANDVLNISISDLENVEGIGDAGNAALTATSSVNITVNPVNDAPVLENAGTSAPILTTIDENVGNDNGSDDNDGNAASINDGDDDATANANNNGNLISDLIRGVDGTTDATGVTDKSFASDVDYFTGGTTNGNPNEAQDHGVAIYNLSNDGPADGGTWQFSTNSGTTWTNINTTSVNGGDTALLLASTDKIRFVPDTDNGATATVSYYLWDGLVGNSTGQHGTYVDVSSRGGITNYSTAGDIASIVILDVNDNPVLDLDGSDASSVSTSFTTTFLPRGNEVMVVDTDMTITDVDHDATTADTITQATVSITGGALDNLSGTIYETLSAKASQGGAIISTYVGSLGAITFSGNGSTTVTLNGVGTWADYEAALKHVFYINANPDPIVHDRTITVVVKDGGDTTATDDKLDSNIATTTIHMPWAPVIDLDGTMSSGRAYATSFTEGGAGTDVAYDNATVTDQDGNIKSLTLTLTNPTDDSAGNLEKLHIDASFITTLSGLGITTTNNDSHAITFTGNTDTTYFNLALRNVQYINTSENPSITPRIVTVSAIDQNDNPSVSANTTINVIPVNDAPVLLGDYASTLYEGALYTLTTADLSGSDVDDSDATLEYLVTTATANGTLFRDTNGNGEVDSAEALGLNATFTKAQIDAGLIKYRHNGGESASDTFNFTLRDGQEDAAVMPTGTFTFTIDAINDAPTLSATVSDPTFTEDGAAVTLFSGTAISGVDTRATDTISSLTFTVTNVQDTDESLTIDGTTFVLADNATGTTTDNSMIYLVSMSGSTATVTLTKVGGIATADAQTLVDTITYSNSDDSPTITDNRVVTLTEIKDNGGSLNGGNDTTALDISSTITLAAVNDTPTGLPTITGTIAQGQVLTANTGAIADADGLGVFSYVWQSSSDNTTWDDITSATQSTYTLSSSEIGKYVRVVVSYTDGGGTLETLTSDNAGTDGTHLTGQTVGDTNDAPTLTATGTNPTALDGAAALFSTTAVDTIEAGQTITGLTLTISGLADGANEKLKIDGEDIALTDGATAITATNSVTYSISITGSTATVTLTHAGLTSVETQDLVDALSYVNSADAPSTGSRVVTLTGVTDTDGSDPATSTLSISSTVAISAAANTAPTVATNTGFTQDEGSVHTILASELAVTDTQQANESLTFTIGNAPSNGTLFKDVDGNGVVNSGEALTNGATFTQAEITAGKIKFAHDGSETTTDNFTFTVSDGTLSSAETTTAITITPVNDAPTLSATAQNPTALDGTASLFSASSASTVDAGQLVTQLVVKISGIADAGNEKLKIDGEDIVLTDATSGTTATNSIGYSISVNAGTATVTLTNAGLSEVDTNTLIDSISYINDAGTPTNGLRVVTLSGITDDGADNNVSTTSISSNVNITTGNGAGTVNTAPTVATNTGVTLDEGTVHTIAVGELAATDTEHDDESLTYTIGATVPQNGTLFKDVNGNGVANSGEALTTGSIFTQADITAGKIKYAHDGGETIADSFTFTVSDGLDATVETTTDITITPINDAPLLSATGTALTIVDGSTPLFSAASVDAIEVGDTIKELVLTVSGLKDGAGEKLTVNGSDIILTNTTSGVASGSVFYSVAVTGTTATVTLSHFGLTELQTKTLIESISYKDTASVPSNGVRAITITSIKDSGATNHTTTTAISSSVDVGSSVSNTVPTVTQNAFSANEGSVHTVLTGELAATDTQQANSSITFTVGATVPTQGTLFKDTNNNNIVDTGEELVEADTFTQLDITNGKIKYLHDGNETGAADSFTFTVSDSIDFSAESTTTITVTPNNDAPTLSATALSPTYTENGASVTLFDATAIDTIEADNIASITLTISGLLDGSNEKLTVDGTTFFLTNTTSGNSVTNTVAYSVTISGSTATVTLTKTDTTANWLTYIDSIEYSNTSDTPRTTNRIATLTQIKDDGGSVNEGHDATVLSLSSTIIVVAQNDAPTLSTAGFSVAEGGSYTLTTTQVTGSDVDNTTATLSYVLSTAPTQGTLYIDANGNAQVDSGEELADNGVFTQVQLTSGKVRYQHDGSELNDTFSIEAKDSGAKLSATQSVAVTRTPVNDAPTISNLNADALSYPAASGAVVIDVDNNAAVTDPDSSDFNGGVLTVSISLNNDAAHDTLSIKNIGTGAGEISISSANVSYGGTLIGTYTGGSGANNLAVTLNSSATEMAVSALVKAIEFTNDQTNPTNASRNITFTLTDGDGGLSQSSVVNVSIQANNAPSFLSTTGFYIVENTTNVTTVHASDPNTPPSPITYSINGGADSSKFAIDGVSGALTFITAPDYENPTDTGTDNIYDVTVRATNAQSAYSELTMAVNIVDVENESSGGGSGSGSSSDTAGPVFGFATVTGTTMTVQYTDVSNLDATNVPANSAYTVLVNGSANSITNTVVNATAKTVTLTLANAITYGQTVTLAYMDPTAGDDTAALQDESGNDSATLVATAVTNLMTAPASSGGGGSSGGGSSTGSGGTTTTTTVDGVTVQSTTTTNTSGNIVEQVIIEPVSNTRVNETGPITTAEIPLLWGESSRTAEATTVSLPVGVGLTAPGSRAPIANHTIADSINDLITLINETTPTSDSSKSNMLGGGSTFLNKLNNVTDNLVINKITLNHSGTSTPSEPITFNGTTNTVNTTSGDLPPVEALVIDAQELPSNTLINLNNIEFATIIGENIILRGGEGKNTIFTGDGHQNIMLGADDDELHAGGGDDTVGSEGGDDLIFGEAGNDTVFGGEGNDLLHGGSGMDVATYSGNMADYIITRDEGKTYVALASNPSEVDTLINAENIEFADNTYAVETTTIHEKIATLYMQMLDRQAEIDGFQYWVKDTASLGNIALGFITSQEYKTNNGVNWETLDVSGKVEQFYEAILGRSSDAEGKQHWLDFIASGATFEQVAQGFVDSIELSGIYQSKEDWNFSL